MDDCLQLTNHAATRLPFLCLFRLFCSWQVRTSGHVIARNALICFFRRPLVAAYAHNLRLRLLSDWCNCNLFLTLLHAVLRLRLPKQFCNCNRLTASDRNAHHCPSTTFLQLRGSDFAERLHQGLERIAVRKFPVLQVISSCVQQSRPNNERRLLLWVKEEHVELIAGVIQ